MNPRRGAPRRALRRHAAGTAWASSTPWARSGARTTPRTPPSSARSASAASARPASSYKQEFWRRAPQRLQDELDTLARSQDRLGDILIRMKKITTPQLLDALVEQKDTGRRLGEILVERGAGQAGRHRRRPARRRAPTRSADTMGVAYAASPVWEQGEPDAIIQYILALAARKGASDVQHRAQGGRRLRQVPHRRLLLPRRPHPQAVPGRGSRSKIFEIFGPRPLPTSP